MLKSARSYEEEAQSKLTQPSGFHTCQLLVLLLSFLSKFILVPRPASRVIRCRYFLHRVNCPVYLDLIQQVPVCWEVSLAGSAATCVGKPHRFSQLYEARIIAILLQAGLGVRKITRAQAKATALAPEKLQGNKLSIELCSYKFTTFQKLQDLIQQYQKELKGCMK